jgi:4-amino-4-deoxy-L-arabinose transferase-like glycosyltransferase
LNNSPKSAPAKKETYRWCFYKSHIAILLAVALAIGIYIITTTVMIAQDGVAYITLAQDFTQNPSTVIRHARPFGYPLLIFIAAKITACFSDSQSIYTWVYSAQTLTLLCRILSLIPLYLIGRLLIGSRRTFWAILILILLPYPAEFGSDVLRDWPHIFFLASALAFLIYGARNGKWYMFAFAGLFAGLGHTIRFECAQILIYCLLWLVITLFTPNSKTPRLKAVCLTLILLTAFAIPAVPFMIARGRILAPKLDRLVTADSQNQSFAPKHRPVADNTTLYTASYSNIPANILRAVCSIAQQISENLMYFFTLPLAIGLFAHFRKPRKILHDDRFFIIALMLLYALMMSLLYINHGYISRRHCMPLIVFTCFYIPVGLNLMARWLSTRTPANNSRSLQSRHQYFFILILIGFSLCFAKFTRILPLRWEKQGCLNAALWLNKNTQPSDIVASSGFEPRIEFYCQRPILTTEPYTCLVSAGKINPGTWFDTAGTFDGQYAKLYINGKQAACKKPEFELLDSGKDNLAIGKPYAHAKTHFHGAIDQVSLFSKALNQQQVTALSEQKCQTDLIKQSLILSWPTSQKDTVKTFDGIDDYIDLSCLNSKLNVNELTIFARAKVENSQKMNWIAGNAAQFRIGIHNSKVYFWISQKLPGNKIPEKARYIVKLVSAENQDAASDFKNRLEPEYSSYINTRKKNKKIVVYKVIR